MMPRIPSSAALIALCLTLAACGDKAKPAAEEAAPKVDPNVVIAPEALRERIKIGTVGVAPFSDVLRVPGLIDFDRQRVARIGAPVTGRITDITANLGQSVKPGDVLARLRDGKSNKQIAHELGLTEGTVKVHVTAILRHLGVRNRTQAALTAQSS